MDSILDTVKHFIGASLEDSFFDSDIIMAINNFISFLFSIGGIDDENFQIKDSSSTWNDFPCEKTGKKNLMKSYICIKSKLMFDPPASSVIKDALEAFANEIEFRIQTYDKKVGDIS